MLGFYFVFQFLVVFILSPFSAVVCKHFFSKGYSSHSYLEGNSSLLSNLGYLEAAWLCDSAPDLRCSGWEYRSERLPDRRQIL